MAGGPPQYDLDHMTVVNSIDQGRHLGKRNERTRALRAQRRRQHHHHGRRQDERDVRGDVASAQRRARPGANRQDGRPADRQGKRMVGRVRPGCLQARKDRADRDAEGRRGNGRAAPIVPGAGRRRLHRFT